MSPTAEDFQIKDLIKDPLPQGTVDEMNEAHLPLNQWGACCEPNLDAKDKRRRVLGCAAYYDCKLPEREGYDKEVVTGEGKAKKVETVHIVGPRCKGLRLIKVTPTGTRIIQRPTMCHQIPRAEAKVKLRGGVAQIIADEGEKMLWQGSYPVTYTDGDGKTKTRWVDEPREITITPFLRPKDNPKHRQSALAAQAIADERAREAKDLPAALLGFSKENPVNGPQ